MRTVTRRCIQNGEDGTHHGDQRLANSMAKKKKKKTNGADRGYCSFRNGDRQTDNPPQKQGGIFAGDAGGRELGSAEL